MNLTSLAFWRGVGRKAWLALLAANDPWTAGESIDVTSEAVRRMVARARLDQRREAGAGIVRKFSRDPVVERRERCLEERETQRASRKPVLAWKAGQR